MRTLKIVVPVLAFWLTACSASSSNSMEHVGSQPHPTENAPAMESTSSKDMSPSATAALARVAKKGMAYADFRSEAIALGWTPAVDPMCKANVAGADHVALCAGDASLMSCRACDEIPELSAYSGDARSLSIFRNGSGLRLEVTGLGELKDWNVSGEDSGLQVLDWEVIQEK